MPEPSTRHGTSTQQPSGRFEIRPWLATLPFTTRGVPVSIESMISEPYSLLGFTSRGFVGAFELVALLVPHGDLETRSGGGYSSSGTPNCSIRSGRPSLMNHGVYSAKCSLDSVTK